MTTRAPDASAAIERDLAAGIDVVADRYAFSGIAFSAAKVRCCETFLIPGAAIRLLP